MIIRDEIHGTIKFTDLEEEIIDCREFQRLRRIKQMSVTNLVYPGANHTRFEHSLGTVHLASLISQKLGLDNDTAEKVRLYALLHDIGHSAFSHEGEDVLMEYIGDHESIGNKLIQNSGIADTLRQSYNPKEIIKIGKSKYGEIINSDLGADRMDYLKRDALNTGVAYGIIDIDRIIHTLVMKNNTICIEKGGLEAAEYLLIARFMMFSAVYMHKTVRIATAILHRAIMGAISDGTLLPEQFMELGDENALLAMLSSKTGGKYASMLRNRKLYKEVFSIPTDQCDSKKSLSLEKELCEQTGEDIIVDYPNPFFKKIELSINTENGFEPITRVSKLVQSLENAEHDRMMVLILANEGVATKSKNRIINLLKKSL